MVNSSAPNYILDNRKSTISTKNHLKREN